MNTLVYSSEMALPIEFCWTRVGVEAGQSLPSILRRKEQEREANGGLFFWGIGNAIGPSIAELIRRCPQPEVVFSPIKAAAREVDINPVSVAVWTTAESLYGTPYKLPSRVLITSRFDPSSPKGCHYALVCSAHEPLAGLDDIGTIEIGALENLLSGKPVGASQVTAVVRRSERAGLPIRTYSVVLRTRLIAPFFLRLGNPMFLPRGDGTPSWDHAVGGAWTNTRRQI